MTALACLRVLPPEDHGFADSETMAVLVGRIGGAFLESCWNWPRRWGVIAPFAFALADPRTDKLEPGELQVLAGELHRKLFGDRGEGDVCLMVLESRQDDIMRFALAEPSLLREMIARGGGAVYGRLTTVTPETITPLATLDTHPAYPDDEPTLPAAAPGDHMAAETGDIGFRGVYQTARQTFIGAVVAARSHPGVALWSPVDGLRDMPLGHVTEHDFACLDAAREAAESPGGVIFVPINFSALVHGAARRIYEPVIAGLPIGQRHRLAAAVYDTPREPSWSAISRVKSLLSARFALVDLQVADPAFAIDTLPQDCGVTSITFALPEGDEKARLAAARRFMSGLAAFRRHRIWPSLTNVRTRRELSACLSLKTPFVTGRAVSGTLRAPPDMSVRTPSSLPYLGGAAPDRSRKLTLV